MTKKSPYYEAIPKTEQKLYLRKKAHNELKKEIQRLYTQEGKGGTTINKLYPEVPLKTINTFVRGLTQGSTYDPDNPFLSKYKTPKKLTDLANKLKAIVARGESYNSTDVQKFLGLPEGKLGKAPMHEFINAVIEEGYAKPEEITPKGLIYKSAPRTDLSKLSAPERTAYWRKDRFGIHPDFQTQDDWLTKAGYTEASREGKGNKFRSQLKHGKDFRFDKWEIETKQFGFRNNKTGYSTNPLMKKIDKDKLKTWKKYAGVDVSLQELKSPRHNAKIIALVTDPANASLTAADLVTKIEAELPEELISRKTAHGNIPAGKLGEGQQIVRDIRRTAGLGEDTISLQKARTDRLNKLQDYLIKNIDPERARYPATSKAYINLLANSGLNSGIFNADTDTLRKIMAGKETRTGVKIKPELRRAMLKLPPAGLTSTVLAQADYPKKDIKKVMYVQDKLRSLKDMDGKRISLKGIHFEHKFPKALIQQYAKQLGMSHAAVKKSLGQIMPISAELNLFKSQYDKELIDAWRQFMQDGNWTKFKKKQAEIRANVKALTGGYEMGQILKEGDNFTAYSPDEVFTKGAKGLGPSTTQLREFFKASKYHNALAENWNKASDTDRLIRFEGVAGRMRGENMGLLPEVKGIENLDTPDKLGKWLVNNPDNPFTTAIRQTNMKYFPKEKISNFRRFGGWKTALPLGLATMLTTAMTSKDKGLTTEQMLQRRGPGSEDQVSEEVIQEPGTTELEAMDFQIDQPASMAYNATEGNFVNAEGERETQPGVLNWIADNPTKSSLAAMPLAMGAGFALEAGSKFGNESVARRGLGRAGRYLKGWKALIPAMMIPHALHEYKAGYDLPEMVTNPVNALWALGIRGKKDMAEVAKYYEQMKAAGRKGLDMTTLKGLKSVEGWKRLPKDFQTAMMSPAAKGTNLAFGTTFRKPFVKTMQALDGIGATQGAKAWGKKALLRAALIPAGILAATPAGWLTAGFLGADFLWDQYKDYRDGNIRIDEMRARGEVSEDEADNYRSLILQGSIPFGIGNRMFGPDTMNIGGQDLDPTQQRELLKGMESQLDEWQAGDMERRSKYREDHFEDGGRVGFKTGGMDRRTFLKWLAALAAGATGIFRGKSKDVVKPIVADATKAIPAKFLGVEGMPAWFPRVVAQIKTHGKLLEMADKHYVQGDIYEMVIPVKVPKFDMVGGKQKMSGVETVQKKVVMEDNPLTGEIEIRWSVDDFDGDMTRQINFKPGEAGYQRFGVDDAEAAAQGVTEFQRVKVQEPEFSYGNPDQSHPERADFDYKDIFTEGDEVVKSLEELTKTKQLVAKDGTVFNIKEYDPSDKVVDEAFQKKIYKDIEGEEAIIPTPEGAGVSSKGDVYGEEEFLEIIGGDIPEHLKKKAKGGVVETGNIAREPGAVPPLSGPTPQGEGIVGLFSNPKQVNVGS